MSERKFKPVIISVLIGCYGISVARANPHGGQVAHGQVGFDNSQPGILNITNSPNAIINWQSFSNQSNEVIRFLQQSAGSAVLNRVVGQDPSQILGQLLSNGHVFLINPNGIIFGQSAVVDTAGLLASTLNISDGDFLKGSYVFTNEGAGHLENHGLIRAGADGNVILIAPQIENSGVIQTEAGSLILAAGEKLTIASLDSPDIRFEIQAPANQVVNLGQLIASHGGAIDIFAGSIQHSGAINADSVQKDAAGHIQLLAQGDIGLSEASKISASGASAGDIRIESTAGTTLASGTIEAVGHTGRGGRVEVLGERVGLLDQAKVDASGETGGGQVLLGGDYQGKNPSVHNAQATYVGQDTHIRADALRQGDGGKVVVWSEEATRYYGKIDARGGSEGGNGGSVETSGHYLDAQGVVDASAARGQGGQWLLDPDNITIQTSGSDSNMSKGPDWTSSGDPAVLTTASIQSSLDAGTSVSVTTGDSSAPGTPGSAGDITVASDIVKSAGGDASLTLNAHNDINLNASIRSSSGQLGMVLNADADKSGKGAVNLANGASIVLDANGGTIDASSETVNFSGGTATIDSTFNVAALNWSSGTLTGTGTLNTSGLSTLGGDSARYLQDMTWNNAGTLDMSGTGYLYLYDTGADGTAALNNLAGGVINMVSTAATPFYGSGGVFNNAGTLNWNAVYSGQGYGYSVINIGVFNNDGTVNVNDNLQVYSNGTHTGNLAIAAGKTLAFESGTQTLETGAAISGAGTVEIAGATINLNALQIGKGSDVTLAMSSGTLNGNADLTIGNAFSWTGGTIAGAGALNTGGVTTLSGDSYRYLQDKTWNNAGTINLEGGGYLYFNDTGTAGVPTLNNVAGGILNMTSTAATPFYGSGVFNNAGVLNWNAVYSGYGYSQISAGTFNNSGTVNVNDNLHLTGDGTDAGNYTIAAGKSLVFDSGTRTLDSGSGFAGTGAVNIAGATINLNTAQTLGKSSAALTLSSGTLNGNAGLTINNAFTWTGGTIAGAGALNTGGVTTLSGDSYRYLQDKTWNNTGTINLTGAGYLYFNDTGTAGVPTLNNQADGVINMASTSYDPFYGSGIFNNAGVLNWNAAYSGYGYSLINVGTFNNSGTVNVNDNLHLADNGTDVGNYTIAAGKSLVFDSGTRTLDSGSGFAGTGAVNIAGATINLNTAQTLGKSSAALTLSSGTLNGNAGLTINNAFTWTGGIIAGSGALNTAGVTTLSGDSYRYLQDKTWNNTGTINLTGAGYLYLNDTDTAGVPTLNNQTNGVINMASTAGMPFYGTGVFNNAGALNWNAVYSGYGYSQISAGTFNNSGTVNVNDNLHLTDSGTDVGNYTIAAGKTLVFDSGTRTLDSGSGFAGTGAVNIAGATINLNAAQTLGKGGATLILSSGTLNGNAGLTINNAFTWTGGIIAGSGALNTAGVTTLSGDSYRYLQDKTWSNTGTINLTGAGYLYLYDTNTAGIPKLNNQADGVINMASTSYDPFYGNGIFNNAGILNWNAVYSGYGYSVIDTNTFNNDGTVNVNSNLHLTDNGTDTGIYAIAAGDTLAFVSGTRALEAGASVSGTGTLEIAGATINLNTPLSLDSGAVALTLSNGSLNGKANLTIGNAFIWTGGTLAGSGALNTLGVSTLSGGGSRYLQDKTWNNKGTINLTDSGYVYFNDSSTDGVPTLNNQAAGVINMTSTNYTPFYGTGIFNNAGTLNWNAVYSGYGYSQISTGIFNNTGTVNANENLYLYGDGTDSGSYAIASGKTLTLSGGNRTLEAGADFSGAGGTVKIDGATLNLNAALTLGEGAANLVMASGNLNGNADLTINNAFTWIDGTIAGDGALNTSATTAVSGDAYHYLMDKTWNNTGTIDLSGSGKLWLYDITGVPTLNNQAGGVINMTSTNYHPIYGGGVFNNAGTLNWDAVDAGNGYSQIEAATFNNSGTVNVNDNLYLPYGGSDSGAYVVAADKTLAFTGGTRILGSPGSISGAGSVDFSGATVNFFGSEKVGVNASQTLLIDNGPIQTVSYTQPAHGTLVDNGNGTFTYTPNPGFTGQDSFALAISDSNGHIADSATITLNVGGSTSLYTWTGGSGLWSNPANWDGSSVPVNGSDVVIPVVAGSITITFDASAGKVQLDSLKSGESFTVSGGQLLLDGSSSFASGTTLALSGGSLGGSGSIGVLGNFLWSGGSLVGSGSIDVANALTLAASGSAQLNGPQLTAGELNILHGALLDVQSGALGVSGATSIDSGATLSYNGGTLSFGGAVNNDGLFEINTGTVSLSGGGSSSGIFDLAHGATLSFGGAPVFNAGFAVQGSGNLLFDTSNDDLVLDGPVSADTLTLTTSGNLSVDGKLSTATGNVSLTAGGGITQNADIQANGDIDLIAQKGDFTQNSGVIEGLAGGNVSIQAGNIQIANSLYSQGDVTLNATHNIRLGEVLSAHESSNVRGATTTPLGSYAIDAQQGHVSLTASGTINQAGVGNRTGGIRAAELELLGAGGNYQLAGLNNVVSKLSGNTGTVSFTDHNADQPDYLTVGNLLTTGNISLTNYGSMTSKPDIESKNGEVYLATHSPLNIGGDITAWGDITLRAGSGLNNTDVLTLAGPHKVSSSNGNISLTYLAPFAGDVNALQAPNGIVLLNGVAPEPEPSVPTHEDPVVQQIQFNQQGQVIVLTQQSPTFANASTTLGVSGPAQASAEEDEEQGVQTLPGVSVERSSAKTRGGPACR